MNALQIILIIIGSLILVAGLFFAVVFLVADKQASKLVVVGTTLGWQESKVPFIGRIVIEYTKKGKPYQTATGFKFKPKHLKIGAKNKWVIYSYHAQDKPTATKAKRCKT